MQLADFKCVHRQFFVIFIMNLRRILIWRPISSRINNRWSKRYCKLNPITICQPQTSCKSLRKSRGSCRLTTLNSSISKSWTSSSSKPLSLQNHKSDSILKHRISAPSSTTSAAVLHLEIPTNQPSKSASATPPPTASDQPQESNNKLKEKITIVL